MRIFLNALTVTTFVAFSMLTGVAAENTVTGMLVEANCGSHLGEAGPSDEHVACMVRCARNGDPIGILTDDGLYTITGDWVASNGDKLAELKAQQVTATGETSDTNGQLVIEISTIELLK